MTKLFLYLCLFVSLLGTSYAGINNLQDSTWNQYFLTSQTNWGICSTCVAPEYVAYYTLHQTTPSLSGNSTKFFIGGTHSYLDVLWNRKIVRYATKDGLDVVENTRHFVYEADFYVDNLNAMQGIEFDINQFFGGKQYTWGHECRGNISGNEWDIWQASGTTPGKGYWRPTGIPCFPKANAWNHIRLVVERKWDMLHFVSIEMNGTVYPVNKYYEPGPIDSNWHAITVNFQLDGNKAMDDYTVWLDKVGFYYWF